jgi:predicted nucleic acid-binding protein
LALRKRCVRPIPTAISHARGRDVDLAIAACALEHGARLWTLNRTDFKDVQPMSRSSVHL